MGNFLFKSRLFLLLSCLFLVVICVGCGDLETELSSLTISPSNVTVGVNQSQLFSVTARNTLGFIVEIEPTWSVSGGIGTITSSGLFVAGDVAGSGAVIASSDSLQATANVTVTENGKISGTVTSALGVAPGIKIYLDEEPTYLDYTDTQGKYELTSVPVGTYFVTSQATDVFQSASREVTVGRGETKSGINLSLSTQPGVDFTTTTTTLPW
jgi:hypothetical protein